MKFAVIGHGFIGPKHIESIKHVGGEIVAVCDIDPKKKHPDYPFFTDYKEAIKDADVVSICTPNYLHTEMILESARQGKTILSEKPMTFRAEELELLKGVPKLFGVFQLRYLPEINEMRKCKGDAQLIVEMKRSHTYHLTWKGDPEKTGGLLFNIGCHYLDIVGHLYGYTGFRSTILERSETRSSGILHYDDGRDVNWLIHLTDEKPTYERSLTIGDKKFDLSQPENMHTKVYENLMWGQGITAKEEEKIVKMINAI